MDTVEEIITSPIDNVVSNDVGFEPPIIDLIHPEQDQDVITITESVPENSLSMYRFQIPQQFIPMDTGIKIPYANYYAPIEWDNGYEKWDLVRFATPMDNNCLFHAITNSFYEPYHTGVRNGKRVDRNKIVTSLRQELSERLASKISDDPNSPTHYEIINNGNNSTFSDSVHEFKLSYMQNQLNSAVPIGYGYIEFIGNALNKDIYILEALRRDIYVTDELPFTIKGNRKSIILYYMNGHYELAGIKNKDGKFNTHFNPDHELIRFLYDRVQQYIN